MSSDESTQVEYRIGKIRLMMTPRQAEIWNGVNPQNMAGATINLGGFWLPLWPTVFSEDTDNTLAQSVCDRRVDRCDESPCG